MIRNIDYVVDSELCTRCGACKEDCASDAVYWDNDFFPHVNAKCTDCSLCLKVCGGIDVDLPKYCAQHYGKEHSFTDNSIGPLLYSEAAYSADDEVRGKGASGGIVSQILISMLDRGEIDGAVVAGYSADNPTKPEARIARTRKEILECAQSKYSLFPVSHIYHEIASAPGRYAVVGIPCQIHSLFNWKEINPKIEERVVLIIGLFCHVNLEPVLIGDLARIKHISTDSISKFEYRGGHWPGRLQVTMNDSTVIPLHGGDIKDGAFNYLNKLYVAKRCMICTDYSAELSDIAVSDPWIRDSNGEYMYKGGWSVAHIRTKRGDAVFTHIKERNEVTCDNIDQNTLLRNNSSHTQFKKRGAFIRLEKLKKKGKPVPDYHMQPPVLTIKDHIREYCYQASLFGWYIKPVRLLLLKLAFSSAGWQFGRLKSFVKKIKYRMCS